MNGPVTNQGVSQPPLAVILIIACVAMYFSGYQLAVLALWPLHSGHFGPWQLVSYAFLHGSFNHLFFNMFALYMFGGVLERRMGSIDFFRRAGLVSNGGSDG